jgi:4,5-dihydroxyphthalate decarboxylase
MSELTVVLGDYPQSRAVGNGKVQVDGYALEPVKVDPVIGAYRRMIRDLEFGICELAPVSYLMALQTGVPLTGIPVFINRRFHHSDLQCAAGSGIRVPRDLEGRRIGVRAYTVSTCVWVRGILQEDYKVDVDSIRWVTDDEDHISGRTPATVEKVTDGRSLGQLLRAGDVDAALGGNAGTGRAGAPTAGWTTASADVTSAAPSGDGGDPYPMFENPDVRAADWYLRTGIYPLHSMIALRSELVEQDPALPSRLYAAFAEAKRAQVAADPQWSELPRFRTQSRQVGGDPVPYGITSNAASIAALVRFSRDQGLIDADLVDETTTEGLASLFAAGDYPDA